MLCFERSHEHGSRFSALFVAVAFALAIGPATTALAATAVQLPQHIPSPCVAEAAQRYVLPEAILLSIMKVESGGKVGVVGVNKNGTKDYGPAQLNSNSWAKIMTNKFGITVDQMTNNMCQALLSQAYAIRSEWNRCISAGNTDVWCAVANYHSPTKYYQQIYVNKVWKASQKMIESGQF